MKQNADLSHPLENSKTLLCLLFSCLALEPVFTHLLLINKEEGDGQLEVYLSH